MLVGGDLSHLQWIKRSSKQALSAVGSRQVYNEKGALFDGLVLFFFFSSRDEVVLLQGEESLHVNLLRVNSAFSHLGALGHSWLAN